jgi:hypothetical protein
MFPVIQPLIDALLAATRGGRGRVAERTVTGGRTCQEHRGWTNT